MQEGEVFVLPCPLTLATRIVRGPPAWLHQGEGGLVGCMEACRGVHDCIGFEALGGMQRLEGIREAQPQHAEARI
jgi:hypothetical protein